ncbi:DNA translocase FtsK [subsurface metagenome]
MGLVAFFDWGLIFIGTAILTLIVLIWRRKLVSLVFHWNRWLGSIALVLAIWGILGFLKMGGTFGQVIINFPAPAVIGILRVLGLVILGLFLVTPRACFRLLAAILLWLGGQFKRKPAPRKLRPKPVQREAEPSPARLAYTRPGVAEKPPILPGMEGPLVPPEITSAPTSLGLTDKVMPKVPEKEKVTDRTAVRSQQELRQVAQEVWKKYGQSSDLATLDGWRLPPIEILDTSVEVEFSQADNMQRAKLIEEALASYGVEVKVAQINAGPTVTQFGLEPGWDRRFKEVKERDRDGNVYARQEEVSKTRVKVDRISSLANDLALTLAVPSLRIEAPVPGKSVVGIEVPNTVTSLVSLRGVVETSVFQKLLAKSKLALALGQGAGGEAIAADLTKMPHLLIAGATGSGKTVCLNTIICGLLMHNVPTEVRFIMVDPLLAFIKRLNITGAGGRQLLVPLVHLLVKPAQSV